MAIPEKDPADGSVRTPDFEVVPTVHGAFLVLTIRGRYKDDLLEVLRRNFYLQRRSLAIDVSALSGMAMPLARSFCSAPQANSKTGDQALALLNPPDALRQLLKLLGVEARFPVFVSASQLPEKPGEALARAQKYEKELAQIKHDLETNALWQFADREYCWLCPFCGEIREEVKIPSRVSVHPQAVERAWRHLHTQCRSYSAAAPQYLPREALETKVRRVSQDKFAATKGHVEELASKVGELEVVAAKSATLREGVKIAASRQRKLLPTKAPEVHGCEIAFTYRPAEEVSGDLFDFVELGDGRLAFVIGDVSGHGIEAGILMGMTKKVLAIRLCESGDPMAAVKRVNADLVKDLDRQSFVSVAAVVYDPARRLLSCARAGHCPPLLLGPRGRREFASGGLAIGMAQPGIFDAKIDPQAEAVEAGDVLILYTDGIEEAKNAEGNMFGVERIVEAVQGDLARPAGFILGSLFHSYDRFVGALPQEDDVTAICAKFL
jgi:serine phosphatase RsbU (regulator of sigma subunit)